MFAAGVGVCATPTLFTAMSIVPNASTDWQMAASTAVLLVTSSRSRGLGRRGPGWLGRSWCRELRFGRRRRWHLSCANATAQARPMVQTGPDRRRTHTGDAFVVQRSANRLVVMTEMAGDRRDRPTSLAERVSVDIILLCEHGTGLPKSWLLSRTATLREHRPVRWDHTDGEIQGAALGGSPQRDRLMALAELASCDQRISFPLSSADIPPPTDQRSPNATASATTHGMEGNLDSGATRSITAVIVGDSV